MILKTCSVCSKELPATNEHFHWKKKAKQTLEARCKDCTKEYHRSYTKKNAEYIKNRNKEYRQKKYEEIQKKRKLYRIKNKDKIKERSRIYREKYPQELKERKAKHYKNNKEYYKKRHKEYYENNYEKIVASVRRNGAKRRALIMKNGHEPYTEKQVIEKYGTVCHLCNVEIDFSAPRYTGKPGWQNGLHIDHVIPISRGGPDILENVRPSHGLCNLSKNAFDIPPIV